MLVWYKLEARDILFILRGDLFPIFESSFPNLSPKWALISSENPHLLEDTTLSQLLRLDSNSSNKSGYVQ